MKTYEYGSSNRKDFMSNIATISVWMNAINRILGLGKHVRIVIDYDPHADRVKTTVQTDDDGIQGLTECKDVPL